MKRTEENNYGFGFWFEFADGCHGWVLSLSEEEKKQEEEEHGKLIKWIRASGVDQE